MRSTVHSIRNTHDYLKRNIKHAQFCACSQKPPQTAGYIICLEISGCCSFIILIAPPASLLWLYGPNGTLAAPKGNLTMWSYILKINVFLERSSLKSRNWSSGLELGGASWVAFLIAIVGPWGEPGSLSPLRCPPSANMWCGMTQQYWFPVWIFMKQQKLIKDSII